MKTEKNVSWILERLKGAEQVEGILNLRKIVFAEEDKDKENKYFWNWEFNNNYAGKAKVFLATDNKRIVGHYAVCPSRVYVDGKEKHSGIVVDVMTHPDYRFQGMFTKIGEFSLKESGKEGIDFCYGFPIRKEVLPGHLKVGWKIAFPLPVYVMPVDIRRILKKYISVPLLSGILSFIPQFFMEIAEKLLLKESTELQILESDHFDDSRELRRFIDDTKHQHRIMQDRSYAFLNWRYNRNSFRKYRIFSAYDKKGKLWGYAVTRKAVIYGLECITLLDIQVLEIQPTVIRTLLNYVRKYAKKQGAALIGCMINANVYKNIMLKTGFIKSPYIFKFILHNNRKIDYFKTLMKSSNWYLTWADTDDL